MFDDRIQKVAVDEEDWTRGPEHAPVTILEYGDFQCPRCAEACRLLRGLRSEFPDGVRWIFRHFPIATVHPEAILAAEAAEAAGVQGAFWPMHDLLFAHQDELDHPYLLAYAEAVGIDDVQFATELGERTHLLSVKSDFRRGIRDGANGTPSLFINGRRYDGALDRYSLSNVVQTLLEFHHGSALSP
jgi:protein-disulfide isomerase